MSPLPPCASLEVREWAPPAWPAANRGSGAAKPDSEGSLFGWSDRLGGVLRSVCRRPKCCCWNCCVKLGDLCRAIPEPSWPGTPGLKGLGLSVMPLCEYIDVAVVALWGMEEMLVVGVCPLPTLLGMLGDVFALDGARSTLGG